MYQSNIRSPQVAPYFEPQLDRRKLALIIPLFIVLLAGAVYRQRVNLPLQSPQLTVQSDPVVSVEGNEPPAIEPAQANQPATDSSETAGAGISSNPAAVVGQPAAPKLSAIQPLPHFGPKEQPAAMPLTLASPTAGATILQSDLSRIEGTAAPGAKIFIDHGTFAGQGADGSNTYRIQTLGEVTADPVGRWQLWLAQPLGLGAQQLSVKQLDPQSGMQTTVTPVEFSITNSTANVSTITNPVIHSPQASSRFAGQCAGGAGQQFSGVAMPGWALELYINKQLAGQMRAGINQAWAIEMQQPFAAGAYVAHTVLLSPGGEVAAESPPVAFTIMPCQ